MIYFTADHHFEHTNIIKYCKRPFPDAEKMNENMIYLHNTIVKRTDDVYVIGDFCLNWGNIKKYAKRLNGNLHLIIGNHDTKNIDKYFKAGFKSVHYPFLKLGNFVLVHDPDMIEQKIVPRSQFYLCGHVHEKYEYKRGRKNKDAHIINVGVDVNNFKPMDLTDIKEVLHGKGIRI